MSRTVWRYVTYCMCNGPSSWEFIAISRDDGTDVATGVSGLSFESESLGLDGIPGCQASE